MKEERPEYFKTALELRIAELYQRLKKLDKQRQDIEYALKIYRETETRIMKRLREVEDLLKVLSK